MLERQATKFWIKAQPDNLFNTEKMYYLSWWGWEMIIIWCVHSINGILYNVRSKLAWYFWFLKIMPVVFSLKMHLSQLLYLFILYVSNNTGKYLGIYLPFPSLIALLISTLMQSNFLLNNLYLLKDLVLHPCTKS